MIPTALLPLLERLRDSPRDDVLRRVLADALMAEGDVRGDFIALTLRAHEGTLAAVHKKKLAKLFKRHRTAWLGALANVAVTGSSTGPVADRVFGSGEDDWEIWEKGFPVRLAARLHGTTLHAPEWATVRELILLPADQPPLELAHPCTRQLTHVRLFAPAPDDSTRGWRAQLRAYLAQLGREALLDSPTEWLPVQR